MIQQILLPKFNDEMEEQLINLFHSLNIPLHFNKTGNKFFTNYQRISLIILFYKSKNSLRDFVIGLKESKWVSWLQLKSIPGKSTLHDWIKMFNLKLIRKIVKKLSPKNPSLSATDGTGLDSLKISRHYERRIGRVRTPYAKVDLFVDLDSKKILDFSLVCHHRHDILSAKSFCKRNNLKGLTILCDKGYDAEWLHRLIFNSGGKLFAPVRKMSKNGKKKFPKGWFRKKCVNLPDFMGKRSIIESINFSLKQKQINSLRAKKVYMKQREFGWQVVGYNLRMSLKSSSNHQVDLVNFFILKVNFFFSDRA